MMNHGLEQSNRLIIEDPGLTLRHIERSIYNRISHGATISEVLLKNKSGNLITIYKKNGRLTKWSAPAGNESVVISYGIVTANI